MAVVKYAEVAQQDLIDIWVFIAKNDPVAADGVIDFIEEQLYQLAVTPTIGRVRGDLWPEALCFPVFKSNWRMRYMVFYRSISDGIEIARIIEGHRDILDIFAE